MRGCAEEKRRGLTVIRMRCTISSVCGVLSSNTSSSTIVVKPPFDMGTLSFRCSAMEVEPNVRQLYCGTWTSAAAWEDP